MKKAPYIILLISALFWALVLKNEFLFVIKWWAVFLLIGMMFYPLSMKLFSTFTDRGFQFSKVIGLAVSSYAMWLVSFFRLAPISTENCIAVSIAAAFIISIIFFKGARQEISKFNKEDTWFHVATGESIFFVSLCFWAYLRGFNPKIEGLEKFMDYGFVNSIIRSGFVPPKDMWFAGESINYYYFGQYVTAFVTKFSGIKTEIAYNLMMATLFAFSMALCFSIAASLLKGFGLKKNAPVIIGGLTASMLVSLGGNLHSFFYGFLSKFTAEGDSYWFPDATRYIGYNPETKDKTIHEFPVYSFVVSDLHAHVINMVFVLLLLGVLLAVFRRLQKRVDDGLHAGSLPRELFFPEMLLIGLLIGIFQMSNYWDFPIYLTVTLFTLICTGIRQYGYTMKTLGIAAGRFIIVIILSLIFALPFNLTFEKVATGIAFSPYRSLPHQLFVLWGYQLFLAAVFVGFILYTEQNVRWKMEKGKTRRKLRNEMTLMVRIRNVLEKNPLEDVFALILCISAIGLVLIPELVYVKDIYEAEHKRANTMFKLTYQAFIMFGLAAGYIIIRIRQYPWKEWKTKATLAAAVLILPMIYPFYAIPSWYKDLDHDYYEGLDGMTFLQNEYPDDYELVEWIRDNIEGQPNILEANGDSYTHYGRISMATGLPTIQGWYVHEWLWRDNVKLVQARVDEVKIIYESDDLETTRELLDKYQVNYIVIGDLERKMFPEINEEKLLSLGTVVFERPSIRFIQVR